MTASDQPTSKSSSRRALLAGALGGIGALAAAVIGRASPARANDGDVVNVGGHETGGSTTWIENTTTTNDVFWATTTSGGTGVFGRSIGIGVWGKTTGLSSSGVYGEGDTGVGVHGNSNTNDGVLGTTGDALHSGVNGSNSGSGNGVYAYSNAGVGLRAESASGYGVRGTSTSGTGVAGNSSSFTAIVGTSVSGVGIYGQSSSNYGMWGASSTHIGVYGETGANSSAGVLGWSHGTSTGVQGHSGINVPAAKAKTGVYGYAAQDGTSKGVWGDTTGGHGIHGSATNGYAGYFDGKVYTNKFHEMAETTTPTAPSANKLRLFARDNGSGKTQLCVRFPTGAVQVIKTEP
jgi:hypothetical protein